MPDLTLPLIGAGGEPVDFVATINSHGVASLPPVKQNAELATELDITLRLADGSIRTVHLAEASRAVAIDHVRGDAAVRSGSGRAGGSACPPARPGSERLLRLPRGTPRLAWITGGYGRMLRCQTVFEEVIKTILTTNCNWSATVKMTERLVTELGEPDQHHRARATFRPCLSDSGRHGGTGRNLLPAVIRTGISRTTPGQAGAMPWPAVSWIWSCSVRRRSTSCRMTTSRSSSWPYRASDHMPPRTSCTCSVVAPASFSTAGHARRMPG